MPGRWGTSQWLRTPMVSILAVSYNDEILTPARPQHHTAGGKPRNRNPLRIAGSASRTTPATEELSLVGGEGKRFESARRLFVLGLHRWEMQKTQSPRSCAEGFSRRACATAPKPAVLNIRRPPLWSALSTKSFIFATY